LHEDNDTTITIRIIHEDKAHVVVLERILGEICRVTERIEKLEKGQKSMAHTLAEVEAALAKIDAATTEQGVALESIAASDTALGAALANIADDIRRLVENAQNTGDFQAAAAGILAAAEKLAPLADTAKTNADSVKLHADFAAATAASVEEPTGPVPPPVELP
jgi:hypothetical protein